MFLTQLVQGNIVQHLQQTIGHEQFLDLWLLCLQVYLGNQLPNENRNTLSDRRSKLRNDGDLLIFTKLDIFSTNDMPIDMIHKATGETCLFQFVPEKPTFSHRRSK